MPTNKQEKEDLPVTIKSDEASPNLMLKLIIQKLSECIQESLFFNFAKATRTPQMY